MIRRIIPETCGVLGLPGDMTPEESVVAIIENWNPKRFSDWPKWVRMLLCNIAQMKFQDREIERRAHEWICREAPNWWPMVFNTPPTVQQLAAMYDGLRRGGR